MIAENIHSLRQELGRNAELLVVSKNRSIEEIKEAWAAGQRLFAENRVQSLLEKKDLLPADIRWHLIGHLQTNKVKDIAPFIECIQSVDSMKLLRKIDEQGARCGRVIDCLLQIHIADEETKFGLERDECLSILGELESRPMKHVRIRGLMGMATNTSDRAKVSAEFTTLRELYDDLKERYGMDILSMGMSSDYDIAIACGSNMVRVGSKVFE